MNVRFVVVATLKLGALKRPAVLDDANQWRAFSAWREDESRETRAAFEMRERVEWIAGRRVG